MPPLTPLPPTSTPNPRCWEPSSIGTGGGSFGHERSSVRGRQVRRQPHTSASPTSDVLRWEGDRSTPIRAAFGPSPNGSRQEAADFVRRRRAEVFGAGSSAERRARPAVRAKSTPTDPVTIVDTETERLLRDRLAELRPGDPIVGEEEGGSAVGHARQADVGARPDRRDGQLRLRHRGVRGVGRRAGRRRSVAGAVANVADGRGLLRGARRTAPTLRRDGVSTPLRCNADRRPVDGVGGHRFRLRAGAASAAGRGAGPAAARRPRRAADRLLRAGSVHGGRGPARRVLRGRRARVGLGGGRADRRGGRAPDAPAAGRRARGRSDRRRGAGHRRRSSTTALRRAGAL